MKRVFLVGLIMLLCAGAWGDKTAAFIFTTTNSTGALAAADVAPTGAYWSDGVANPAVTVTVTTTGTAGVYKASLTWPAVASGSISQVVISATIGGVASGATVLIEDNLFPENVWSASTKAITANGDKSGYSISGVKTTLDALNDAPPLIQRSEPPSAATIAAAVWDYAAASCTTAGSIGKKLYYWLTTGRIGNI